MSDVLMYFEKGGLVMYPLLICSLVIIFIAIERYLFYKSIDSGHLFTKQYCDILSGETLEKAFEFAKTHKGACANILTQASPLPTVERTEAFMEMKGNIVMSRLREKLSYLSVITTLAPLLGLLGTIVGMITTFSIFNIQAGQPMAITGGIGENAPNCREEVCENMEFLGIKIDKQANDFKGELRKISTPDSKVEVWVIPTNEELVIARSAMKFVK